MRWLLLLAALCATGCSTTNISELVQAMAKDAATGCLTVTYAGALVIASRTNITNGNVECSGTGMKVTSTPVPQNLPVTVTPVPTPPTR